MAEKKNDSETYLPLSPAMFHVLLALADGERHGYAILKEVALRTDGKVQLSAGTLYGIIHRLHAEGMIIESGRRPALAQDDERRRYYRLTDLGRKIAVAEATRMEEIVAMARAKKLFPKAELA